MGTVTIDLGVVGDGDHARDADLPRPLWRRSRDRLRLRVAGAVLLGPPVATSGAVHIDLGLVGSEPDDVGRDRWGRAFGGWRRSLRARLAVAAAMTVLAGGAVTGAAPPSAAAGPVHVATVTAGDTALLDGDRLYVHRHLGDPTITAYRLSDGAMLWQTANRPGTGTSPVVRTQDGVPLATFLDDEPEGGRPVERTTAYDPETGAERWSHAGYAGASGDGVVVLLRQPHGQDPADGRPLNLPVAVDLATGREIWTGQAAPVWAAHQRRDDQDGHRLVTLGDGGVVTSYELSTGARVTATVPAVADPWEVILYLAGELVLVHHVPSDVLHGYDVATLTHRWSDRPPSGHWFVSPCGPMVCLHGPTEVHAIDPATGGLRWSAELEPLAQAHGPWGPRWPGRLLLDGWLVDAATGARVLSLPTWEPLPDGMLGNTGTEPILRWLDWGDAHTDARTWFARLDAEAPGVEVLGHLPGRLHECTATTSHLVCRDGDDTLQVWRLP